MSSFILTSTERTKTCVMKGVQRKFSNWKASSTLITLAEVLVGTVVGKTLRTYWS